MSSDTKSTKFAEAAQMHNNRIEIKPGEPWVRQTVAKILAEFPDQQQYTVAAGISPSGIVHIGNLRDVMISEAVGAELRQQGKAVRFIFSWDNFDRFRKVPANVDSSWGKHIGKPLSAVPDPIGQAPSYAEHWQKEFELALVKLGIDVEYRYQTEAYKAGTYDQAIQLALDRRDVIADILLRHMSDKGKAEKDIDESKYRNEFSPLAIYSRFTGKDNTKYLSHKGSVVNYYCTDTQQVDSIDIRHERNVKLGWKIDWPMRWAHEGVVFEPGGKDHAAPGGSYDVSSEIAQQVFGIAPPVFVGYEFIGVQGLKEKMSGSAGNAITPAKLLEVFDPEMVRWLYNKRAPNAAFNFDFGTDVVRQYEEFDRGNPNALPPFRQTVAFGQIVQWDAARLDQILGGDKHAYSTDAAKARLVRAKNWLETYNPDQAIKLRTEINQEHARALTTVERKQVIRLRDYLTAHPDASIAEIEAKTYEIPKTDLPVDIEVKKAQRSFFETIYLLLISQKIGPRLSTFLSVLDRKQVLNLLDIESLS